MWVSGTVGNIELILATVASVSAAVTLLENDVSCIALRPRPIRGVCGLDRTIGDSSCFRRWKRVVGVSGEGQSATLKLRAVGAGFIFRNT